MTEYISEGQQEILSQIVPIIAEKLGVDPDEVTMEASLSNDLGADSLDRVELMIKFDQEFNLCIPDYDYQSELIQTIGDVVRLIEQMSDDPNRVTPKKPSPQLAPKVAITNPATPKTQLAPEVVNSKKTVEKSARVETIPQNVSGDLLKTTVGELLEMPVEQALNLFNQIRTQMALRARAEKKK